MESKTKTEQTLPGPSRPSAHPDSPNAPLSSSPFLALQRTLGNQAMLRLFESGRLQAKLRISQPGDADEQEADRVAEQIVSRRSSGSAPALQRKCACGGACPKCKEEKNIRVQRKSSFPASSSGIASNDLVNRLGAGRSLDLAVRKTMESRFGQDFSQVRVHVDDASTRSLNAQAYTVGTNIVFGGGQCAPGTANGFKLLAHELTHTIQQTGSKPQQPKVHKPLEVKVRANGIQRQPAAAPDPDKFRRCKDLLSLIKGAVAELVQRTIDLITDPQGLQWDNWDTPKIRPDGTNVGSVRGHQQQYEGWRNRLRNLIEEWDNDDCNSSGLRVPQDARDLVFRPVPAPVFRPQPQTGPKPWTSPGADPSGSRTRQRIGAAAKGAAIGASAGIVVGGVVGAIVGGVGGTVVAPGVGTVGVGAAGAAAGAEAGAPVGAAIGLGIGSLVGWLTGD